MTNSTQDAHGLSPTPPSIREFIRRLLTSIYQASNALYDRPTPDLQPLQTVHALPGYTIATASLQFLPLHRIIYNTPAFQLGLG